MPLSRKGGKSSIARVTIEQDRYFLVGDEVARLSLSCVGREGPAPCEVLSSEARVPPDRPEAGAIAPAGVLFRDDGEGGDASAEDGVSTAAFAPGREGFGGYHGPLGILVSLRVDGEEGGAVFELQYTPAAPARFTGSVREAMEDGSLCLYVGLAVERPGRYVLHARADDADAKGFAFLEYNESLEAGAREARMCLFGALVLDQRARAPFVLRDLEGFLLLPDTYPDRELMPALEGKVYTTRAHDASEFSGAEWQSEEKQRHVDELTRDVAKAKGDVERGE